MEKPAVDRIDGICPSSAIRQKNSVRNPRSPVGTVTEIHDYMRLLYARVGRTICRKCGQEVIRETAEVVTNRLLALPEGTRLLLGFDLPVVAISDKADQVDEVESAEADQLHFRTFNFPGWTASFVVRRAGFNDGSVRNISPNGPAGAHRITLKLRSAPIRRASTWITILSSALLVILGTAARSRGGKKPASILAGRLSET